jgi:hypothetical protein
MVVFVESEIEQYAATRAIPIESLCRNWRSMSAEQVKKSSMSFIRCSFITISTCVGPQYDI